MDITHHEIIQSKERDVAKKMLDVNLVSHFSVFCFRLLIISLWYILLYNLFLLVEQVLLVGLIVHGLFKNLKCTFVIEKMLLVAFCFLLRDFV